jgi:hypothetical protein
MKAAHAGVGAAPCRKSGYMGRKRNFQMLSLHAQRSLDLAEVSLLCSRARRGGMILVCEGGRGFDMLPGALMVALLF